MARLSKRVVDAARAGSKRSYVWDGGVPGFGFLLLPSGSKSFIYQYRDAQGRDRRITVGKVGTLTPDQARRLAGDMAHRVKLGGDPLADKIATRNALTVAGL